MITAKTIVSHKGGSNKLIMLLDIPDDWFTILLEYQDALGHKTLDETIGLILMDYINEKKVELKKREIEAVEHEKSYKGFIKETQKREKTLAKLRSER